MPRYRGWGQRALISVRDLLPQNTQNPFWVSHTEQQWGRWSSHPDRTHNLPGQWVGHGRGCFQKGISTIWSSQSILTRISWKRGQKNLTFLPLLFMDSIAWECLAEPACTVEVGKENPQSCMFSFYSSSNAPVATHRLWALSIGSQWLNLDRQVNLFKTGTVE